MANRNAVIVGVGDGLSASLARLLASEGYDVHMVARDTDKLKALSEDVGGTFFQADATDTDAIRQIVQGIKGSLDVAVYNPSFRTRGPIADLDPGDVKKSLDITAYGSFVLGQAAAQRMLTQDGPVKGTILFTGASAGVKGFANSAPFAMGKFAQRGLAQSMSRELHPKGIHVVWINIDGAIRLPSRTESEPGSMLNPDEIARGYLSMIQQEKSVWSNELTLRPWVEGF